MTTLETKRHWNLLQGRLNQKSMVPTHDLSPSESRQEELVGRIQKRTDDTLEQVESTIKACRAALSALFPVN